MTIVRYAVLAALACATPAVAQAQDASVQFWLKGNPNNLQGCIAADPTFTREQTGLINDGQVAIKFAGGVNVKLKETKPKIYTGNFDLGRMNLNIVADLSVNPRTLTIASNDGGCKWSAVKE
jgi:hypothetical protein